MKIFSFEFTFSIYFLTGNANAIQELSSRYVGSCKYLNILILCLLFVFALLVSGRPHLVVFIMSYYSFIVLVSLYSTQLDFICFRWLFCIFHKPTLRVLRIERESLHCYKVNSITYAYLKGTCPTKHAIQNILYPWVPGVRLGAPRT